MQSYEHQSRNNWRKSSQSKVKAKKLLTSPTKNANFSPYKRFNRPCSSLNIDDKSSNFVKTEAGETLSLRIRVKCLCLLFFVKYQEKRIHRT